DAEGLAKLMADYELAHSLVVDTAAEMETALADTAFKTTWELLWRLKPLPVFSDLPQETVVVDEDTPYTIQFEVSDDVIASSLIEVLATEDGTSLFSSLSVAHVSGDTWNLVLTPRGDAVGDATIKLRARESGVWSNAVSFTVKVDATADPVQFLPPPTLSDV